MTSDDSFTNGQAYACTFIFMSGMQALKGRKDVFGQCLVEANPIIVHREKPVVRFPFSGDVDAQNLRWFSIFNSVTKQVLEHLRQLGRIGPNLR